MPKENLVPTITQENEEKNITNRSPVTDDINEQIQQNKDFSDKNLDNIAQKDDASLINIQDNKYEIRIEKALKQLKDNSETYLTGQNLLKYSQNFIEF